MSNTRTNEEWLYALKANGEIQETAIIDLRDLLLHATLYFFHRNQSDLARMNRDEILKCAEDCAQEALIAVMNHLADFRGDSKFTTWAYKFAINMALMTARRERWKGRSLEELSTTNHRMTSPWAMADTSSSSTPDRSALQGEISQLLREVIEQELTDKQRQLLMLMVFHEVPMDKVVQQLGTNRNAIYKMLHDARRKLKSSLQARGFEVSELLTLFHDSK